MKPDFFVSVHEFSNSIRVGMSFTVRGRMTFISTPNGIGTIEGVVAAHYNFETENLVVLTSGAVIKLI